MAPETRERPRHRGRSAWRALAGCTLALGIGCKSESDRTCLDAFAGAQQVVLQVQAEDVASVEGAVAAVAGALEACRRAGREGEVEELAAAHGQLVAHRDRAKRRDELRREQRRDPSPEELARIVASGDPKCPAGQAYLHKKSGQRIRCTGPQPASMDAARATEYFKGRGYKTTVVSDLELRFEYGAELLMFLYSDGQSASPPRCVVAYPPPDRSWQETLARLTGVPPARWKAGSAMSVAGRRLELKVEESPTKVIARLGDCDAAVTAR